MMNRLRNWWFRDKRMQAHEAIAEQLSGANRVAREAWGAFDPERRVDGEDPEVRHALMQVLCTILRVESDRLEHHTFIMMLVQAERSLANVLHGYSQQDSPSESNIYKLRIAIGALVSTQRSCARVTMQK